MPNRGAVTISSKNADRILATATKRSPNDHSKQSRFAGTRISKLRILTKRTKITVWGDGCITYLNPSRIGSLPGRSGTVQACCQWGEWASLLSTSWPKSDLRVLLTMLHSQVPVCRFVRPHRVPLCRRLASQFTLCVETTGAPWQCSSLCSCWMQRIIHKCTHDSFSVRTEGKRKTIKKTWRRTVTLSLSLSCTHTRTHACMHAHTCIHREKWASRQS